MNARECENAADQCHHLPGGDRRKSTERIDFHADLSDLARRKPRGLLADYFHYFEGY